MPRLKQKWAFVLKVSLASVEPSVWRRIVVPSTISLKNLHEALQIIMGWGNYHLHLFESRVGTFGIPDPDFPGDIVDESRVRLDRLIGTPKDRIGYEYDFGDCWQHELLLERVVEDTTGESRVWCIDGARACPPEDIGGPPGYELFLAAIEDHDHEAHEELLTWIGGEFDPEAFDIQAINQALTPRRGRRRTEMSWTQNTAPSFHGHTDESRADATRPDTQRLDSPVPIEAPNTVRQAPTIKLPLHESDIPFENWYEGTDRHIRGKALCDVGGQSKIGVGILELFPGSTTRPGHWHSLEEEHLYVLSGMATLHLGTDEFLLKTGSYVCFPANQAAAHYLHNHTQQIFRYIMIGERIEKDDVVYPFAH